MRIGFIGTGRIARRLVTGATGRGHALVVTRRNETVSAELAAAHPEVDIADTPAEVVDRCDALFLCLPVERAREVLPDLPFRDDQAVISVMVGLALEELRDLAAPAQDCAITVPMPSIARGGCPLPVYPASDALATIYGERNPILPLADEGALRQFFAVAGTVLSLLDELRTAGRWLAEQTGDTELAERYVTALYAGYLATLGPDGDTSLDAAIEDLSIEGGLNASMRDRVAEAGHYEHLRAGLDGLLARLQG